MTGDHNFEAATHLHSFVFIKYIIFGIHSIDYDHCEGYCVPESPGTLFSRLLNRIREYPFGKRVPASPKGYRVPIDATYEMTQI